MRYKSFPFYTSILIVSFLTSNAFIFISCNEIEQINLEKDMSLNPSEVVLVRTIPETVKVLSLNNSLIECNNQDMMFNNIASSMGKDATWTKHTFLGESLNSHWKEGDGLNAEGNPGAKMMVRSDTWTHIILQEYSNLPSTDVETFRVSVKKWEEYIREYCPNPNAIIILPINWAYSDDWTNYTATNNTLITNYQNVAKEFGITLCPVACAYQAVYDAEGIAEAETLYTDDRHPTNKATYMTACMEYSLIFGEDALNINYHPSSISNEDASLMRNYVHEVMLQFVNYVDHTAGIVRFDVFLFREFGSRISSYNTSFSVDNGGIMDGKAFISDGTLGTFTITATNDTFTKEAHIKVAQPVTN